MRAIFLAFSAAAALSACGQSAPKSEAPAATTDSAAPPTAPFAPMSLERTALCASALEAWKGLSAGQPPGGMTVEAFGQRAPLVGLRGMELERADRPAFTAARASADAAWKDKTPADIEAATVACLGEIKG